VILDDLAGLARSAGGVASGWLTPSVRLGVTGLARAGKTVFITSLVHNLVQGGRLPFFSAASQGRLLRAYLEPQPDDGVPRFAYEEHLATLTGSPPDWPESTRRVSQLRLSLEYEPTGLLWRQFGTSTLHLDIIDYPGEWLLDLPLLKLSFAEWSAEALALSRAAERQAFARDWHAFLGGLDPKAPEDEQTAIRGAELFAAYLRRCREDRNLLSTVTPGRMLMPGELAGSPAVTFMPLDPQPGAPPRGSLAAMMERRFEAYKAHVVKPFFRDHFARLDRQIVLVDVLGAMTAGSAAVADLERALTAILNCFRPGTNSWLAGILGKRIDRILFAATKADHIHHTSHDRLEAILQRLVQSAIDRAVFSGASVQSAALAAIRATREVEASAQGGRLACIAGTPLPGERLDGRNFDGGTEIALFPGDLPAAPNADDAGLARFRASGVQFLRFRPPAPLATGFGASPVLPHIRLDRAIQFLIGDKLE
jgi:predicted YcjX-like family ATPase